MGHDLMTDEIRLPMLNQEAPDFDALTCEGRRTLGDYKGQWLVLFSHPADFTPVCTTELISFARASDAFSLLKCKLLGLSIDSHHAHIAWKRNIAEKFGVKIPFPIIADVDMRVSQAYGMIHPGASNTETVRCVFIIDPNSVIRSMVYYPMSTGRSVFEIVRVLRALQIADENGVNTPEGWKPGDNVIVAPPSTYTTSLSRERMAQDDNQYELTEWYFCERPLHVKTAKKAPHSVPNTLTNIDETPSADRKPVDIVKQLHCVRKRA
jgi:peroxiredoxin (alkyl hydroperoxide reductase subunit C)